MKHSNKEWSEIKQEADVDANGARIVKKVTFEKAKQEDAKFLGMTTKDWVETVLKFIGLLTIAISILQYRNQIVQQEKQDDQRREDELKQAESATTVAKNSEKARLHADSIYRNEQIRLQKESNRQSKEFNRQLAARLKIAADERIANYRRDEDARRFTVYGPAVGEIEALLDYSGNLTDFSNKVKLFKLTTMQQIQHVSDKKTNSELDTLVWQLDMIKDLVVAQKSIDSLSIYYQPFINFLRTTPIIAKIPENARLRLADNSWFSPDIHTTQRFLSKDMILDSLDTCRKLIRKADVIIHKYSYDARLRSFQEENLGILKSAVSRAVSVIDLVDYYTNTPRVTNAYFASILTEGWGIIVNGRDRQIPNQFNYVVQASLNNARKRKDQIADLLRQQGSVLRK